MIAAISEARLDQQGVDMPVVAPGELDDHVASGESPGDTDRAHGRLGSRVDHADHFHRRDGIDDGGGERGLGTGGGTEAGSLVEGRPDRILHRGMLVSEDVGTPRADVVDELVPIDVIEVGPFAPVHDERLAPHPSKGPGGTVHPTGNQAAGVQEFGVAVGALDRHGRACFSGGNF